MKHTLPVTIAFLALFIIAQLMGLYMINLSIQEVTKTPEGEITITYSDTTIGERPQTTGIETLAFIIIGVTIGTIILLFFVKYQKVKWWKTWFFLASWLTMSIAIGTVLPPSMAITAWAVSLGLALWKIYKPNIALHNLTEILMYSGIAILLVPILSVPSAIALLIIIAIYDVYAVWKSRHMVKMAEFTTKTNLFPGLRLSYKDKKRSQTDTPKEHPAKASTKTSKTGVLGGGDIVFPLLFAGTVMASLIQKGLPRMAALYQSTIIVATTAAALFLLFYFAKKNKFYPAMPFVAAGCIAGYLLILLI
jgi:presenilin-like A22 family membrane protease